MAFLTDSTSGITPHSAPALDLRATPDHIEVSVVMPCLNEEAAVGDCVRRALAVFEDFGIAGEVIVCDNNSEDNSAELAREAGAIVVLERRRGYGSAYLQGFEAASGQYIVMADADGTYDFRLIPDLIEPLRQGYDMVIGSRMPTSNDAMPLLHRYIGVPVLTGLLNVIAGGHVSDAHSGMRAFTREALNRMNVRTTGMEFASEMIIRAIRARLQIAEIPIPYYPRVGDSKLHTIRDGWRHLRFLLWESPTLLYVIPGISMMLMGLLTLAILTPGRLRLGEFSFDFHYMVVASLLTILGWQVLTLGLFAKVFSAYEGLAPPDRFLLVFLKHMSLEKALGGSVVVTIGGLALLVWTLVSWINLGFGFQPEEIMLRPALFGMTLITIGMGSAFSAFFLSSLMIERRSPVGLQLSRN